MKLKTKNSIPKTSPTKLGVICSQFPETHETFVVRELKALADQGIPLRIYSLKKCRDKIVHEDAKRLIKITKYVSWGNPLVWLSGLVQLIFHPIKSLMGMGWMLNRHTETYGNFVKSLVVWWQSLALTRRMRRDKITHIHAHWATMPTSAALLVSRNLKIPFSFTAHAWDIFVKNRSLLVKVHLAKAVITCTEYNRRHLQQLCPLNKEKIHLNYHGVDIGRFTPQKSEARRQKSEKEEQESGIRNPESGITPLFLSVGRLVEQKGYEDLIEAYALLKDNDVAFRAVIVGEGPLKKQIRRRIAKRKLKKQVILKKTTTQDELRKLYREAHAFVLPCVIAANEDRDGIPNVILEAMAMGIPVVSTDVSGIPEAVQDQRTGFLVGEHKPDELAEVMGFLIENPDLRTKIGAEARRFVEEHFSAIDHMNKLVGVMKGIMKA